MALLVVVSKPLAFITPSPTTAVISDRSGLAVPCADIPTSASNGLKGPMISFFLPAVNLSEFTKVSTNSLCFFPKISSIV